MVSTKAITKTMTTTGSASRVRAPAMSSWPRIGVRLGGALTNAVGSGVIPVSREPTKARAIPIVSAPVTRRAIRTSVRPSAASATSVAGARSAPRATGAPGAPSATTPMSFRPMKVTKRPMPTAKACLSERGRAAASHPRTRNTVSSVNATPARKIAPRAVCQGKPIPFTTVKAMNAFSPM